MKKTSKRQLCYTSKDNLLHKRNKDMPTITPLNQITSSNQSHKRKFDTITGNYLVKETFWSEPSSNNDKSTPPNIHHNDTLPTITTDNESPRHNPCNTTSRSPDYASAEKFIANYQHNQTQPPPWPLVPSPTVSITVLPSDTLSTMCISRPPGNFL